MNADDRIAAMQEALKSARIESTYDQIFDEVAARITAAGEMGKLDVAGIVLWKRLSAATTWALALMEMPERDVRAITACAVAAVRSASSPTHAAAAGRRELRRLPGCTRNGTPLPSALLCAVDPVRLPVYDQHAGRALQRLDVPVAPKRRGVHDFYPRYTKAVSGLCEEARERGLDWSAHDVDVALYCVGKWGLPDAGKTADSDRR